MTEDMLNPNICTSALEEDGTLDRTKGSDWGAHKWDDTTDPVSCAECGVVYDDEIHSTKCTCQCGNEHTVHPF